MTNTDRRVIRRTCNDTVFSQGKHRRIIAIVGGGKDPDLIRFRLEGTRLVTDGLTIQSLFWQDMNKTVTRQWHEKNARRQALGKRKLKKPKLLNR